jgi:hypothetical protein
MVSMPVATGEYLSVYSQAATGQAQLEIERIWQTLI